MQHENTCNIYELLTESDGYSWRQGNMEMIIWEIMKRHWKKKMWASCKEISCLPHVLLEGRSTNAAQVINVYNLFQLLTCPWRLWLSTQAVPSSSSTSAQVCKYFKFATLGKCLVLRLFTGFRCSDGILCCWTKESLSSVNLSGWTLFWLRLFAFLTV